MSYKIGDKVTYINGDRPRECVVTGVSYLIRDREYDDNTHMLTITGIGDDYGWTNVCASQFVMSREPLKAWEGNVLKFRFNKGR